MLYGDLPDLVVVPAPVRDVEVPLNEIEREHVRVKDSLLTLNCKLAVLENRLISVRTQSPTEKTKSDSVERELRPSSPLADSLREDSDSIQSMIRAVDCWLNELALP